MMNQEDIFKKVGQILNELQDQYEFLAQNPNQLNELELELFLANANFLSDHVQILRKINGNKPLKSLPEHTETGHEGIKPVSSLNVESVQEERLSLAEPETPEPQVEVISEEEIEVPKTEEKQEVNEPLKFEFILNDDLPTDKFEFEEKSIDDIFDRPLSKEEEQIIAQKQKLRAIELQDHLKQERRNEEETKPLLQAQEIAKEPIFEPIPAKVEENTLPVSIEIVPDGTDEINVAQPVKEPESNQVKPTLNDLLAGKNNLFGSLNEDSNKTIVTDLKQAINLNEKLLYIKDLFNGYNLAYAEAIELINKMPDFKTADAFLKNNYAVKNNWALKQSTVDQFYELLNQRFPAK